MNEYLEPQCRSSGSDAELNINSVDPPTINEPSPLSEFQYKCPECHEPMTWKSSLLKYVCGNRLCKRNYLKNEIKSIHSRSLWNTLPYIILSILSCGIIINISLRFNEIHIYIFIGLIIAAIVMIAWNVLGICRAWTYRFKGVNNMSVLLAVFLLILLGGMSVAIISGPLKINTESSGHDYGFTQSPQPVTITNPTPTPTPLSKPSPTSSIRTTNQVKLTDTILNECAYQFLKENVGVTGATAYQSASGDTVFLPFSTSWELTKDEAKNLAVQYIHLVKATVDNPPTVNLGPGKYTYITSATYSNGLLMFQGIKCAECDTIFWQ